MLEEIILPDPEQMHLGYVRLDQPFLELIVTTKENSFCCPMCGVSSSRVHSHYQRELADLPFSGFIVRLHWQVRRFFCDNPNCPKITFAEQIPSVNRYARKTNRLVAQQTEIAFAAGGEPGARLTVLLQIPTSPDTLLRYIRKTPIDTSKTPQYLGVDDWAIRKRHTYGTILVDLETHRPVDLLPERSTETLSNWLKAHPGAKVIGRDRSSEYAKGASEGAPDAVQVADRWHLLTQHLLVLIRKYTKIGWLLENKTKRPTLTGRLSILFHPIHGGNGNALEYLSLSAWHSVLSTECNCDQLVER